MKSKLLPKTSKTLFGKPTAAINQTESDGGNNINNPEEFECCVMCGSLTCVPVSMPIDWREDYEIGCGQLCHECAKKLQE